MTIRGSRRHHGSENSHTDIRQVGRVLGGGMTETLGSLVRPGTRLGVVRVDVSGGDGKVDKRLDEVTK